MTAVINRVRHDCELISNRGSDASIGRYLQRAKMDILNHIGDARALFGAFERLTGVLLYLLSIEYGAGDV